MDLNALYSQALAAQKAGDTAKAEQLYRQILGLASPPEVLVNLGNLLARQNRHEEALAFYDQALLVRPDFPEALFNRGNLLLDWQRPREALESYERLIALRNDFASVWNNRGTALRNLRRLEEALASFEQAAKLSPGHINALTNRAIILWDLKRLKEALEAVDQALALAPNAAEPLYAKANILRDLGRMEQALHCYRQTFAENPAHAHALNGAAQAALNLCDWQEVERLRPQVRAAAAGGPALIQPFILSGYSEDAALQRACAENYVRRTVPKRVPLWDGRRYDHDRIRLAYLSADFHQHPTAQLLAELFETHDRARFEVTAIAFGPDDNSAMRARLKRAFDHFLDVRGKSDLEAAQLLRAREIDIAVDLNGHTADARPGILAHRPSPLQVNYLVYPGTMGADFIDYILADRIVLPEDQQAFFTEKVLYLPDCYQANDATRPLRPAPGRAEAGLPEGFVFCCFNNGWKISRPIFEIWMRLLREVPGSLLWLLDGPHAANLRREAQARSVEPERLVFAPRLTPDKHLARQQLADLFLDTLPYNAHTTASEALFAGLPVVTCAGKTFPGRVAASLLQAVGLPELVTTGLEEYERLALALARDPGRLGALHEKLGRNRRTMPLFDSARFRRNIEAAYEAMLT